MNKKTLVSLFVVAILLAMIGVFIGSKNAGVSDFEQTSLLSLTDARLNLNTLDRISLTSTQVDNNVQLRKVEDEWRIVERDGYPADLTKLSKLLQQIQDANVVELKTANAQQHHRLQLSALTNQSSLATKLTLFAGDKQIALLVGKVSTSGQGQYVRFAESAQTYLIDKKIDLLDGPSEWLQAKVFDFEFDAIRTIHVRSSGQQEYSLIRDVIQQEAKLNVPSPEENKPILDDVVQNLEQDLMPNTEPNHHSNLPTQLSEHFRLAGISTEEELQYPSILDGYVRKVVNLKAADVTLKNAEVQHEITHTIEIEVANTNKTTDMVRFKLLKSENGSPFFIAKPGSDWLIEISDVDYNHLTKNRLDFVQSIDTSEDNS